MRSLAACKIIAAHAHGIAQGKVVVVVHGRLIENLHVEEARRLLTLAKAIDTLEADSEAG